jgi:hypothetical protein
MSVDFFARNELLLTILPQIDPYASALNTTTCGPLDIGCVCQSNTYLSALQDDVPQACDTTDQVPIFSYIMAACSEFGVQISLSTTSVSLTTSTIPTTTVTTTVRTTLQATGTQLAGATGIPDTVTSDCPKPNLSSGASVGIIIAAFALGGLLFAAGAVLILRRRKTKFSPESTPHADVPNTPYTAYTAYSSQSSQMREKPLPMVEAASKRPRAEMMDSSNAGSHDRPAELS